MKFQLISAVLSLALHLSAHAQDATGNGSFPAATVAPNDTIVYTATLENFSGAPASMDVGFYFPGNPGSYMQVFACDPSNATPPTADFQGSVSAAAGDSASVQATYTVQPPAISDPDGNGMLEVNICGSLDPGGILFSANSAAANLSAPLTVREDTTRDGNVDVADIVFLIGQWGTAKDQRADVDIDGVVAVRDLLAVIGAWGT